MIVMAHLREYLVHHTLKQLNDTSNLGVDNLEALGH
jgi:hypothetical protein